MGQKDTVTKDYIRNAEVFADAFNYLLYEGEKIIMRKVFMNWIRQQPQSSMVMI